MPDDGRHGSRVHVDFGQDRLLEKVEMGNALGRSVRRIEELTAEGMPSREGDRTWEK